MQVTCTRAVADWLAAATVQTAVVRQRWQMIARTNCSAAASDASFCHYVSVDVTKSLTANVRLHCDIYEERMRAASWQTFTNEEIRFTVLAFYTMCTAGMNLDNHVCRFRNTDVPQTRFKVAFSSSIYRLRLRIAANLVCCLSSTSRLWWWLRCRLFFQWTTWDVFSSAFQSTFSTLVYSTVYSDWHTDAVQSYSTHCYNTDWPMTVILHRRWAWLGLLVKIGIGW